MNGVWAISEEVALFDQPAKETNDAASIVLGVVRIQREVLFL
jgi:hypothetical protein